MAVKSVVSIDVNDSAFGAFQAKWNEYQRALKSQPAIWAAMNQQVSATRQTFDEMVVAMAAANVQAKLREKAQEHADQLTRTAADRWQSIARSTREFARNIGDATGALLRWSAITGVLSGLVGAGGIWGIDRLALGVAGARRSALGLGTTIGGQAAFEANAARLVDPGAFLANVAGAKFDVTKRVGLMAAGLTPGQIAGDTTATAIALLREAKRIADTTNPALFAQVLQARRMEQFFHTTDLERLRATSPAEFERVLAQVGQRRGQLEPGADVALRWQDFATQMANAGRAIENVLVKGLVNLAPGLTKLSDAVANLFGVMLQQGGPIERWVTQIGIGLEKFAGYVGTDEFAEKVRAFVDGLGKIADTVGSVVSFFAKSAPPAAAGEPQFGPKHGGIFGQTYQLFHPDKTLGPETMQFDKLLGVVRKLEGSGDREVSTAGAIGRYQIMPDTARQYGYEPSGLTDPAYNERVARTILTDLIKRYHGNTQEILAAYNAGPGAANRFRRAGDDPTTLPGETQRYIARARGLDGYSPTVVTIENNTGGNANVSVNALKD